MIKNALLFESRETPKKGCMDCRRGIPKKKKDGGCEIKNESTFSDPNLFNVFQYRQKILKDSPFIKIWSM